MHDRLADFAPSYGFAPDDRHSAARGMVNGILISSVIWAVLIAFAVAFFL